MRRSPRIALAIALALAAGPAFIGSALAGDAAWRDSIQWRDATARIQPDGEGGWRLQPGSGAVVRVPRAADAHGNRQPDVRRPVRARAGRTDAGAGRVDFRQRLRQRRPIPCSCFETGEKWRYVWTRDLSFAADLALAKLRPERTRNALRFKLSDLRAGEPQGEYVVQDTGSGGSWPFSSDRVVWFLAARGLVDAPAADADAKRFSEEVWQALTDTLAQGRQFVDADMGLYRGETSFLDWRERTYPRWTSDDVAFLAQSFAFRPTCCTTKRCALANAWRASAATRARTTTRGRRRRWRRGRRRCGREDRGNYADYIGTAAHPTAFEAYDLLGLSLLIDDSGIAPEARARRHCRTIPSSSSSPVIWPQQRDIAIYHNRAIWPFVSAYSLRGAQAP